MHCTEEVLQTMPACRLMITFMLKIVNDAVFKPTLQTRADMKNIYFFWYLNGYTLVKTDVCLMYVSKLSLWKNHTFQKLRIPCFVEIAADRNAIH